MQGLLAAMKRFTMFALLSSLFFDLLIAEIEAFPASSNIILINESPIKTSYDATQLSLLCYLLRSLGHIKADSSSLGLFIGAQTI